MTSIHAWVTAISGCALLCVSLITVHVRAEAYMEGLEMARCEKNCERIERRTACLRMEFERLRQGAGDPSAPRTSDLPTEGVRP